MRDLLQYAVRCLDRSNSADASIDLKAQSKRNGSSKWSIEDAGPARAEGEGVTDADRRSLRALRLGGWPSFTMAFGEPLPQISIATPISQC